MFSVQGKLVSHDRFKNKKDEEFQTVSIFASITVFDKVKPKIYELFVPVTVQGIETLMDKTVIFPVTPIVKNGEVQLTFASDGRSIYYHNEKGEIKTLKTRPESFTDKPISKVG